MFWIRLRQLNHTPSFKFRHSQELLESLRFFLDTEPNQARRALTHDEPTSVTVLSHTVLGMTSNNPTLVRFQLSYQKSANKQFARTQKSSRLEDFHFRERPVRYPSLTDDVISRNRAPIPGVITESPIVPHNKVFVRS